MLKVDKKRFYDYYGQHMILIEVLLTVAATCTFAVAVYVYVSLLLLAAWLVAYLVAITIYETMFIETARKEQYPLGTLRIIRLRKVWAPLSWLVSIFIMALIYFLTVFGKNWSQMSFGEFIVNIAFVLEIMTILIAFTFPILLTSYLHLLAISFFIPQVKRSRLCLRAFLVEMKIAAKETNPKIRIGLIEKCLRLLKNGLRQYNQYLYHNTPFHNEVVKIDNYYRFASGLVLIGKKDEIDRFTGQIRVILGCIPGRDVKHNPRKLLTTLMNIRLAKEKGEYSLTELLSMTETLTFSERFLRWMKSYLNFVIGAVTIVWFLLTYLHLM